MFKYRSSKVHRVAIKGGGLARIWDTIKKIAPSIVNAPRKLPTMVESSAPGRRQ